MKLRAAGVEVDREALNVAQPRLAEDEPSFERFWEAVSTRRGVTFDYRGSTAARPSTRHLQPWGIVLNPAAGAVLMSLSTIIVAANAQLLRRTSL